MSRSTAKYDDGLDDDGYPISSGSAGLRFVRGSEVHAGDGGFAPIGDAFGAAVRRIQRFVEIGGNCDSPIEYDIGAAILVFFERCGAPLKLGKMVDLQNEVDDLLFVPQFKWSFYRSDWAIYNPRTRGALLIECDGFEFHSSDQQREHDARKDISALDRGFLTMRFTGSQIFRNPDGCAQKVFDAVRGGL